MCAKCQTTIALPSAPSATTTARSVFGAFLAQRAVAGAIVSGADPYAPDMQSDYGAMAIFPALMLGILIGAVLLRRRIVIGLLTKALGYLDPDNGKQNSDLGAQDEPKEKARDSNESKKGVTKDPLDSQTTRFPDTRHDRDEFDGTEAQQPRPVFEPPGLLAARRLGYTGSDRGATIDGIIGAECAYLYNYLLTKLMARSDT